MNVSKKFQQGIGVFAVALTMSLAGLQSARADFKVQYDVGGTVNTVTDNMAGDLDPTVGTIFISTTVNQVTLAIAANSNRNNPEPAAQIQDATVNVQNTGGVAQAVRLTITDTGFTFPGMAGTPAVLQSRLGVSSVGGQNTPLTGTFQSFEDNGNAEFGTTISTSPQVVSFPLPADQQIREQLFTRSETYSLTNTFLLTLPAGMENGASFTGTTRVFAAVPLPGNIALLASVVPALGLISWVVSRRRRTPLMA